MLRYLIVALAFTTSAYGQDAMDRLGGGPSSSARANPASKVDTKGDPNLRTQKYMDSYSKTMGTMSNVMKKTGETQNTIIQNMNRGGSAGGDFGSKADTKGDPNLRLQMYMDSYSKVMGTASNVMKKTGETQNNITRNVK